MSDINQKEYLKRYLGIGKGAGEKKKKKSKKTANGLKIIDVNVDFGLNEEILVDLAADNEEAPQIVSIIDDRPPSLRIDEVTERKLWRPIGEPETSSMDKGLRFEGSMKLSKEINCKKSLNSNKYNAIKRGSCDYSSLKERSPKQTALPFRHPRSDSDNSPPREGKKVDLSPPRRKNNTNADSSIEKRTQDIRNEDISPHRKTRYSEVDYSPPRKIKREKSEDNSPLRESKRHDIDSSPPRRIKRDKSKDKSPPRKRKNDSRTGKMSRWGDREEEDEKLKKTLDGKTAGLQNAADLILETQKLKKKEDELFKNMSAEVSGANAATVVRGKKKEVDWEEEERKRIKAEENKEQYSKWGKGLKQVEDINEKMKNEIYEMSKPIARYADDKDLEKYLKDQEREGDPMLAYIRQKKRKKAVDDGKPVIRQFEGDAPPNRFGIRPGYRWDGVDRSSGYEKQWFQVQNSQKANREEIYRWSTEDM